MLVQKLVCIIGASNNLVEGDGTLIKHWLLRIDSPEYISHPDLSMDESPVSPEADNCGGVSFGLWKHQIAK